MSRPYPQKSNQEQTRKHHPEVTEDWRDSHSNAFADLQHTIGNRAVQRLIGDAIQRQPKPAPPKDKNQETTSFPTCLASITLDRQGELKGNSRVEGHEGKIELLSLNLVDARTVRSRDDNPRTSVTLVRTLDELSPKIANAAREGETITSAKFEFIRRSDDGKIEVSHTLQFTDGIIASYSVGGGDRPTESMEIEFAGISS